MIVDLLESVLYKQPECNKLAMFYLLEYTKWKCDLFQVS